MTVCFDFDPQTSPWATPYDRYNTWGFSFPDGVISTADIQSIPNVLSGYRATRVFREDQRLCDAFYMEMTKLRFLNEVVKPQAEMGAVVWEDKNYWLEHIRKTQTSVLGDIVQRRRDALRRGYDFEWECDWMGICMPASFNAAARFINCLANKAAQSVDEETPLAAGPGILLRRKYGNLPALVAADNEAASTLQALGILYVYQDIFISSIDGVPTSSMTDAELQTALSGEENSVVQLGLAGFDWSTENLCSAEPKETGGLLLRRKLSMGPAITECGGIDIMELPPS